MAMTLHYHPVSTASRAVLGFAAEEGIELDLRLVDLFDGEHLTEGFAAINPNRAVPVLEDGLFRLTECSAILKYLAETHDSPAYPAAIYARARVNAQMDWFNTEFHREFGYGVVYPQALPYLAWPNPAMRAVALTRGERGATKYLDVLDRHMLAADGPFLGGTEPTLADHLGAAYVSIGAMVDFDFLRWPRIERWLAAMQERPGWTVANAGYDAWCEQLRSSRLGLEAA